jgi:hypothetical protein
VSVGWIKVDILAGHITPYKNIHLDPANTNNNSFKMPSVASIDYGFIKSCFFQATRREEFQNKWMSADTWAKLIAKYCITDSTLIFNGTNLDKCLSLQQNEHLRMQMDMRKGTMEDHIGIFREVLRKHGKQRTYYYYAGSCPY